jgi:nuclear GTP-binding protein
VMGFCVLLRRIAPQTDPGAGRIQPDRRWFGNTRTVGQTELETFRDELKEAANNPYKLILGQKKVPWSLLSEPKGQKRPDLVRVEPFEATFGSKATRKRPKLGSFDYEGLVKSAAEVERREGERT